VLEIVLGIVIGPSGLGWVKPDAPVSILALVGLAFLLFLSGLEIDVERLRGRIVKLTALGFVVSFAIAILIGIGLRSVGFGVFIPIFFVTSGLTFDLSALFASASTIARVPLFLLAILLARGLPALVYVRLLGLSRSLIAGILQATSLPFIVAATQIGLQLGVVSRASAAGLVAAGLLSVVISPALGLVLLRRERQETATPRPLPTPVMPVLTAEDRALARASDAESAA
jgi:Kef-type K+ transport system membrane component KefB